MRRVLMVLAASLVVTSSAIAGAQTTPTTTAPAQDLATKAKLLHRAVLPAATFRAGSGSSGLFFAARDRATATANGVTVAADPAPAFSSQPIQGISALIPAGNNEWWALSDNGYGARNNSQDWELWISKLKPTLSGATSTLAVTGGFGLSDPDRKISWPIICDPAPTAPRQLPDFDFNRFPATPPALCGNRADRKLTGFDFDPESMQFAADGTLWIGEEFGPYLLHVNSKGELLDPPVRNIEAKSPQSADLARGEKPNLSGSRGFEAMGVSPDRLTLYPMFEGPLAEDDSQDVRVYEFDVKRRHYTGKYWKVKLAARGGVVNLSVLRRADGTAAFTDPAPTNGGGQALGEMTMINERQAIFVERDSGGDLGAAAPLDKKVYLLDFPDTRFDGAYATKTLLVDLMAIPDPDAIGGDGPKFRFPFTTIESVHVIDAQTIVVVCDNNFPFSNGRSVSKGATAAPQLAPDGNELIVVKLGTTLKLDSRVLTPPTQ